MSSFDAGSSPVEGIACCANVAVANRTANASKTKERFIKAPRAKELPNHLDRITLKVRIGGDQRKFFLDTLCDQNAVKRIAVVKLQAFDSQHVLQRDWQNLN